MPPGSLSRASAGRAGAAAAALLSLAALGGCASTGETPTRAASAADDVRCGREALAREHLEEAEQAFTRATQADPADAEAWSGLAEALERRLRPAEALDAHRRALAAAGAGPAAPRVQFAFRRFAADLAEDGRAGGADPQLALEALVASARTASEPAEREKLRELALDLEARELARRLLGPLGAAIAAGLGQRVAVLPPEWPTAGRPAGPALARVAALLAGALGERKQFQLSVRSPDECRQRARPALGRAPRHADVHDPDARARLRAALGAELVVLLQGGQRVSARLVSLASGDALPRGHAAVFHPSDAAFALAPAGPPLEAEVRLLGQRRLPGGQVEDVLVTDGVVLRTNDQVQVRVRPSQQAHVLILWLDSREKVWRLFPGTQELFPEAPPAPPNPVRRGDELAVPGPDHFFTLDDQTGVETFYVVVSREPLGDEAGALALALEQGSADPRGTLRAWLGERAGAVSIAAGEGEPGAATVVRGHGVLVREVWLRHE